MPRATLTRNRRAARGCRGRRARPDSGDAIEHALRLGLRRAARGREHLAQKVARAVLVADALELLGQLELARERIAALVEARGRRVRRVGRLGGIEVERDAGEVERQRLVA